VRASNQTLRKALENSAVADCSKSAATAIGKAEST
jgi:hypothetical protein